MSFYVAAFETDDGQVGVALRAVAAPFELDGDDDSMDYGETTLMLAFGRDEEAALLQLRAILNAAMGAIELDILKLRRRDVPLRILDIEEPEAEDAEIVVFSTKADDEEGD